MTKPHKHADILIAIAQGKTIQMHRINTPDLENDWWEPASVLGYLDDDQLEFRIKPECILINGHDSPVPLSTAPTYNTVYYAPDTSYSNGNRVSAHQWKSSGYDLLRLAAGMCHLTESAAEKHAQALLSFTKVPK